MSATSWCLKPRQRKYTMHIYNIYHVICWIGDSKLSVNASVYVFVSVLSLLKGSGVDPVSSRSSLVSTFQHFLYNSAASGSLLAPVCSPSGNSAGLKLTVAKSNAVCCHLHCTVRVQLWSQHSLLNVIGGPRVLPPQLKHHIKEFISATMKKIICVI